jgi:hypothetical protein
VATWTEHEKQAIRILIGDGIPQQLLEELLASDQCSVDYNGYGYYVTVNDKRLPAKQIIFNGPVEGVLAGKNPKGDICGYIVFIQDKCLTLEIHPWLGIALPSDFREGKVDVRIVPEGGNL